MALAAARVVSQKTIFRFKNPLHSCGVRSGRRDFFSESIMAGQLTKVVDGLEQFLVAIDELNPDTENAVNHDDDGIKAIAASLNEHGFDQPLVVQKDKMIIRKGNGRFLAAKSLGWTHVPALLVDEGDVGGIRRALSDNKTSDFRTWNNLVLGGLLGRLDDEGAGISGMGWSDAQLNSLMGSDENNDESEDDAAAQLTASKTLAEPFIIPPYSVLDTRKTYWQNRRRAWLDLGIRGEVGRSASLRKYSDEDSDQQRGDAIDQARADQGDAAKGGVCPRGSYGADIFDPVLCELAYRWFCPADGVVLDQFAGGSVRGIVAAKLGRQYVGIELRREQIAANNEQADDVLGPDDDEVIWLPGDAMKTESLYKNCGHTECPDFLFTNPPYFDLEQFSDDKRDLSRAETYTKFMRSMKTIIKQGVELLNDDRFAAIVLGDLRKASGPGFLYDIVGDIVCLYGIFGAKLYNVSIVVGGDSALAPIATGVFQDQRKMVCMHQYFLVFCKGDPRKAARRVGPVVAGDGEEVLGFTD